MIEYNKSSSAARLPAFGDKLEILSSGWPGAISKRYQLALASHTDPHWLAARQLASETAIFSSTSPKCQMIMRCRKPKNKYTQFEKPIWVQNYSITNVFTYRVFKDCTCKFLNISYNKLGWKQESSSMILFGQISFSKLFGHLSSNVAYVGSKNISMPFCHSSL